MPLVCPQPAVGGEITERRVFRLTDEGQWRDTIAEISVAGTVWEVSDPTGEATFRSYREQPFSDTKIVEVSEHQDLVVHVIRDASGSEGVGAFTVRALTLAGDTLFDTTIPYAPVRLESSVVDSIIDAFADGVSQSPFPSAPPRARAAAWARATLYVPEFLPPVSAVVLGRDGSVWLRRETKPGAFIDWTVVDRGGTVRGSFALPIRFQALLADENDVWGMWQDDLDVPYITHFSIAEP